MATLDELTAKVQAVQLATLANLWRDGADLRYAPVEDRRAQLAEVVGGAERGSPIVLSAAAEGDARQILEVACKRGMEGMVAKQKGSLHTGGRQSTWLKVKCTLRQEFAIVGYLPLRKTRRNAPTASSSTSTRDPACPGPRSSERRASSATA